MLPPVTGTIIAFALFGVLIFNMSQRSHLKHGEAKRLASLHLAIVLLFLYGADAALRRWSLPPWYMLFAVTAAALALYLLRERIFIFRRSCAECGTRIPIKTSLYVDDNLCDACRTAKEWPYESEERIDPKEVPEKVEEVDWENWKPSETAVLCYLIRDGKVLLIHKKTGLGKGMVNAPGGRIEAGETAEEAAVRELEEEVGITPRELYEVGRLSFLFTNGFSLSGTVFFAHSYTGEARETEEADPFWVDLADIPYGNMWEDDRMWLPKALAGEHITGRFIFRDEEMLSHKIEGRAEAHRPLYELKSTRAD